MTSGRALRRFHPFLLLAAACAARAPQPPASAPAASAPAASAAAASVPGASSRPGGPPDAQVREELDCPSGEIVYTGGLGGGGRIIVRTLEACGRSATYTWSEAGWTRSVD